MWVFVSGTVGGFYYSVGQRWQHTNSIVCGVLNRCMYSGLVGGLSFVARCSDVGVRWWADVYRACVCTFGGLLLYFLLANGFVTIAYLCNTQSCVFVCAFVGILLLLVLPRTTFHSIASAQHSAASA